MRFILLSILIFIIAFVMTTCSWQDGEYSTYDLDGRIELGIKIDEYGTFHNRVKADIVSVGSDVKFIVVKRRHANNTDYSYYYIDKTKDNKYLNASEITQGPFSEEQFETLKNTLGLPDFERWF